MPRQALPKDVQVPTLSESQRQNFTQFLTNEIRNALDARSRVIADGGLIDTWHGLYEQAERPRHSRPWPDAADLASYLPTEKIDALRARLVQVIFGADPICTVEGWGEPSERVAKVEAFHQWKSEEERLQTQVAKALHNSLVEGTGILEVTERLRLKKTRAPFKAQVKTNEWGQPELGEDLKPQPAIDPQGKLMAWDGTPESPALEVLREKVEFFGQGPQYRNLSLKDFLFLPGHAADLSEVWGYAKRIWLRSPELQQRVKAGLYDADAVQKIGTDGERDQTADLSRSGVSIAPQQDGTAEKELWEVHLLHDIDDDEIEEWLIACVSVRHQALLRVAFDTLEQVRFVSFTPFPHPKSVYGYSFLGHKLWTITEEHTALRNMKADRQAMALNAPILRLTTSTWDPDDQPFGPSAVIDVRNLEDIKQLQIADVPVSTIESERTTLAAAERLSGLNDTAISGIRPETARTATETTTAAQASFVRVEESVKHIQESLEDLYGLRQRLWERSLEGDEAGLLAPESVITGLTQRGITLPKDGPFKFTAADLQPQAGGSWRFKPRGSVETADKYRLRSDFAEFLSNALPAIMKTFPAYGQQIASNVQAGEELFEQALKLWGLPNLQVFFQQAGMAAPQGVEPAGPMPLPPMLAQGIPALMAAMRGGNGQGQGVPPMAPEPVVQ